MFVFNFFQFAGYSKCNLVEKEQLICEKTDCDGRSYTNRCESKAEIYPHTERTRGIESIQ